MATPPGTSASHVSHTSALQGLLAGLFLFVSGFTVLLWNEVRIVERYRHEMQIFLKVRPIASDTLRESYHGHLVQTSGQLQTPDVLTDPVFGFSSHAVRLRRRVEVHDGDAFQPADAPLAPIGHMPIGPWSAIAATVNLGSFSLSPALVREMDFFQPVHPRQLQLPEGARVHGDHIFIGENPEQPQTADMRIFYEVLPESDVSVVAQLENTRLTDQWRDAQGRPVFFVKNGIHDLDTMLQRPTFHVLLHEWFFRLLGALLVWSGCHVFLNTARSLTGAQKRVAIALGRELPLRASGVAAVLFGSISLALPWLFLRPFWASALILLALLLLVAYGFAVLLALRSQPNPFSTS